VTQFNPMVGNLSLLWTAKRSRMPFKEILFSNLWLLSHALFNGHFQDEPVGRMPQ